MTREREMDLSLKEYAETLREELEKNITLQKTIEGIIQGSPTFPCSLSTGITGSLFWNKALAEIERIQMPNP